MVVRGREALVQRDVQRRRHELRRVEPNRVEVPLLVSAYLRAATHFAVVLIDNGDDVTVFEPGTGHQAAAIASLHLGHKLGLPGMCQYAQRRQCPDALSAGC